MKNKLADALGISKTTLNKKLVQMNLTVPPPKSVEVRRKTQQTAKERIRNNKKYAIALISGTSHPKRIDVSDRHIYRLIQTLAKTQGTELKEIQRMSVENRQILARTLSDYV